MTESKMPKPVLYHEILKFIDSVSKPNISQHHAFKLLKGPDESTFFYTNSNKPNLDQLYKEFMHANPSYNYIIAEKLYSENKEANLYKFYFTDYSYYGSSTPSTEYREGKLQLKFDGSICILNSDNAQAITDFDLKFIKGKLHYISNGRRYDLDEVKSSDASCFSCAIL